MFWRRHTPALCFLIQLMFDDVSIYRGEQIVAERPAFRCTLADLARGDLEQRRLDEADFGSDAWDFSLQRREVNRIAGAAHHADLTAGRHEVRRAMPSGQIM